jgi:hypothetical protein
MCGISHHKFDGPKEAIPNNKSAGFPESGKDI